MLEVITLEKAKEIAKKESLNDAERVITQELGVQERCFEKYNGKNQNNERHSKIRHALQKILARL